MNKILQIIKTSTYDDSQKIEMKKNVKLKQIVGFEKDPHLYFLAISNMLFRGDGKSQLYAIDSFSDKADEIIKKISPTIGFINPPYSGKDNDKNDTKKEIQFLDKLLNCCQRYVIMIAPSSVYSKNKKEKTYRNRILDKHILKAIIHMPKKLFEPNASICTVVSVFETHKPHQDKTVLFYNLTDDGLKLNKTNGRSDILNKWSAIENEFLEKYLNPESEQAKKDNNLLNIKIRKNDEWTFFAHGKT